MTNLTEAQTSPSSTAIARWETEGGSPGRPESDKVTSWFVPPIVVPAFLISLVMARAAYVAYF